MQRQKRLMGSCFPRSGVQDRKLSQPHRCEYNDGVAKSKGYPNH